MMYIETIPATVWDWKESGSPETAYESIEFRLRQIQRKKAAEKINTTKNKGEICQCIQ